MSSLLDENTDRESEQIAAQNSVESGAEVDRLVPAMIRRETHSSRAISAVFLALLTIVVAGYFLVEAVLRAIGQPPLWLDFNNVWTAIGDLTNSPQPVLVGLIAGVVALIGLILFLKAILPGRKARTGINNGRAAVVIDNEVIASAIAKSVRQVASLSPEQVLVTVSRSRVNVQLRPTSGIPVNTDAVQRVAEEQVQSIFDEPQPRVNVNVSESGVVGQ